MRMRLGRRGALLAAGGVLAAPVARAQQAPMEAAFTDWMRRHGARQGVLALALDGRLVQLSGYGGLDATARLPVWSLSKLITALAVARLVAEGRLALGTTLVQAMPQRIARHSAVLGPLTIEQLLTHRSGLPRDLNGETVPGLRAALRARPPRAVTAEALAGELLGAAPVRPPGEAYLYSNLNYWLLGQAIESAAGEPYEAYAARAVLERVGVRRPAMDRHWALLGAAGGWSLSAPEYVALMLRGVAGDGLVPPVLRAWMEQPEGKSVSPGSAAFYALGQLARPVPGGFQRWHEGAWIFRWPAWQMDESSGTLAAMLPGGRAWFAGFAPHPGLAQAAELEGLLARAQQRESAAGRSDRFGEFVAAENP